MKIFEHTFFLIRHGFNEQSGRVAQKACAVFLKQHTLFCSHWAKTAVIVQNTQKACVWKKYSSKKRVSEKYPHLKNICMKSTTPKNMFLNKLQPKLVSGKVFIQDVRPLKSSSKNVYLKRYSLKMCAQNYTHIKNAHPKITPTSKAFV